MKTLLTHKQNYEGTITLGWLESVANNTIVASKLIDAGFTDVKVMGTGLKRKATGMWSKPTQEVELPKQVSEIKKL